MTHLHTIFRHAAVAMTALAFAGCDDGFGSGAPSALVVEGWIDNGRFPEVMLTRSLPISDEYQDADNLSDYIEKWARVTVSDGEKEITLVGRYDSDRFPPYVYTTSEMRGEVGRTYTLTVDCADGTHAEAVTSIAAPVTVDSFAQVPVAVSDTLRQLYAYVSDSTQGNCYKLFTHVMGRKYGFLSSYLGIFDSSMLSGGGKVAVNKGCSGMEKDFTPYFAVGDTVLVRLAHVDGDAYRFWRDFEDMVELSRNPMFPVTNNLHSNVTGGLGYWFGYGSTIHTVVIRP